MADADSKIAKSYGVLSERGYANRSTFVIDKKGVLRKIDPNAKAAENAQEILDWVKNNLKD